jgi:hypothetical protein
MCELTNWDKRSSQEVVFRLGGGQLFRNRKDNICKYSLVCGGVQDLEFTAARRKLVRLYEHHDTTRIDMTI